MARQQRRWMLWTGVALVNLAVVILYLVGRGGRRDHFALTVDQGRLAVSFNGKLIVDDFDVSGIPAESLKGIRFEMEAEDEYALPTRLKTRIEHIAVYSPHGLEPLFEHRGDKLDPAVWTDSMPGAWLALPGGGLTRKPVPAGLTLTPPGVPLDSYRIEFDIVNPVRSAVYPLYADGANQVVLHYRSYFECQLSVQRRVGGQLSGTPLVTATGRLTHVLRSIAFELVDTYPYLLALGVGFIVAHLALLTPLSALCARFESGARYVGWIVAGCLTAGVCALVALAVKRYGPRLLGLLGQYAWASVLAAMIAVPLARFAARSLRGAPAPRPGKRRRCWCRWGWAALVAVSVAAGTGLTLWITSSINDRASHNQDATAQVMHARMLARLKVAVPVTEPLAQGHFYFQYMVMRDGRWFSQYPPGHILTMALGVLLRAPWLMMGVVAAGTLALVYGLGARLGGRGVGLIAVWLVIFSPFFQMMTGSFMNHTSATLYWCAALLFFVVALQKRAPWQFAGFGACLTLLFATRPLVAMGLGTPLLIAGIVWTVSTGRKHWIAAVGGAAAGVIPVALLLAAFNLGTTGRPFQMGHQLTSSARVVSKAFRDPRAVTHVLFRTWLLKRTLFDWPAFLTLAPILALFASGRARRWDWLLLGTCVSNVVAWLLYPVFLPMFGPRYWYEMLPVLCLLSARGIGEIAALGNDYLARAAFGQQALRYQRWGWCAAMAVGLIAFSGWSVNDFWLERGPNRRRVHPWVVASLRQLKNWQGATLDVVRQAREANVHDAVVFVEAARDQHYWVPFERTSPFFDSNIVYARCLGSRADRRLMRCFPGRQPYHAAATGDGWKIEPYPEHVPVPSWVLGMQGLDGARPQVPPEPGTGPPDAAASVAQAYPGWELVAALSASLREVDGRKDVVQLHPVSRNVPAVLRWRGRVPEGRPALSFEVAAPPERLAADTLVQVWVGETLVGQTYSNKDHRREWTPCRFDLSAYAGKEAQVDVWVVATHWYHEQACLAGLRIE